MQLKIRFLYRANHRLEKQLMERVQTPLTGMGAYTRKVAMRSLRPRKGRNAKGKRPKPSAPGTPPHSLSNPQTSKSHRIKKNIGFEKAGISKIIIGPRILTPRKTSAITPALHEHGGRTVVLVRTYRTSRKRRHVRGMGTATPAQAAAYRAKLLDGSIERSEANGFVEERRTITYPARPYMKPAVSTTFAHLPEFFGKFQMSDQLVIPGFF